jgi:hypothetical protein
MVVGRSASITGPYVDRAGVPMLNGGDRATGYYRIVHNGRSLPGQWRIAARTDGGYRLVERDGRALAVNHGFRVCAQSDDPAQRLQLIVR